MIKTLFLDKISLRVLNGLEINIFKRRNFLLNFCYNHVNKLIVIYLEICPKLLSPFKFFLNLLIFKNIVYGTANVINKRSDQNDRLSPLHYINSPFSYGSNG